MVPFEAFRDSVLSLAPELTVLGTASPEISLDLHLLRADAVESFCDRLRAHAAREEEALYRWATRQIPRGRWAALGRRLGGAGGRHAD